MDIFLYNNVVRKGKAEDGPSIPIFNVENLLPISFLHGILNYRMKNRLCVTIMCNLLERIIIQ
jgi:hypothetical protein